MDAQDDLEAFRRTWERDRDGDAGRRYAEALADAGRVDDALAVCEGMWDEGWVAGRTDAAWLEHGRGRVDEAIALMTSTFDLLDDEDRPLALGIVGSWRWRRGDAFAEPLLAAGMGAYPTARIDLAALLASTGRRAEGIRVLEEGAAAGETSCLLPLANMLDEEGDADTAITLYERAVEAGDAYAAWNLALVLGRLGRMDEADAWRWRAAQGGDEAAIRSLMLDTGPDA